MVEIRDADELITKTLEAVVQHMGVQRATFCEPSQDGTHTTVQFEFVEGLPAVKGSRFQLTEFVTPRTIDDLNKGQYVSIDDVASDPRTSAFAPQFIRYNVRSLLTMPVAMCSGQGGRLSVASSSPRSWTRLELELLGEVALRLTPALERTRADRELRDSEERLRLAAYAANFGTFDADLENKIVHWSPEARAILGAGPQDDPWPVNEGPVFVHPEDRDRVIRAVNAALDPSGEGRLADEHRIIRPDGQIRWVHAMGVVRFDGAGDSRRAVRSTGMLLDITDRKIFEMELKRAKADAEVASRTKSEFLANMSHEIRTPLSAIVGFADLLMQSPGDEQERQDFVARIHRNSKHLMGLISDMLDIAKIEARKVDLDRVEFQLAPELDEELEHLKVQAEQKGLMLKVDKTEPLPEQMHSDPSRLRQILKNVVGNAIKYTERGEIAIHIRAVPGIVDPLSGSLEITVMDTGIGMTPEQQEKIFHPFVQADGSLTRRYGGAGLGLAISRRLAVLLGGEVVLIHSGKDQGSKFRITVDGGFKFPECPAPVQGPTQSIGALEPD